MIRKLLTIALPLVGPIAVYFVWVWYTRLRERRGGPPAKSLSDGPLVWLVLAGVLLMGVGLYVFVATTERIPARP